MGGLGGGVPWDGEFSASTQISDGAVLHNLFINYEIDRERDGDSFAHLSSMVAAILLRPGDCGWWPGE